MTDPEDERIKSLGHHDVFVKFATSVLRRRKLTDVTIVLGREEIAAHRLILAAFSQYFCGAFTSRVIDNKEKMDITPFNIPSDIFHVLLDFMYTGELSTQDVNIIKVEEAAKKLKIKTLLPLLKSLVAEALEKQKNDEVKSTPSKRVKTEKKGKQSAKKPEMETEWAKADSEVTKAGRPRRKSKRIEEIEDGSDEHDKEETSAGNAQVKVIPGKNLKVTESIVDQLTNSAVDEEKTEEINEKHTKVDVTPPVRRTPRSSRVKKESTEENIEEDVLNEKRTIEATENEEAMEISLDVGRKLLSDVEEEDEELKLRENDVTELQDVSEVIMPDDDVNDPSYVDESEENPLRRGRKSHELVYDMYEYEEEEQKFTPLEEIQLPSDPKDLSWVDSLIEATEKPQVRRRGRPRKNARKSLPRAPHFKTTITPDQVPVFSPLNRLSGRTLKSLYFGDDGFYHCPYCPRTSDNYDHFRAHFGYHCKDLGIANVTLSKNCLKEDELYHCPCCDFVNANYNNFKAHYRKMHHSIPLAVALSRRNPVTGENPTIPVPAEILEAVTVGKGTALKAEEILVSVHKGEAVLEEEAGDIGIKLEQLDTTPKSSPRKAGRVETPTSTRSTRHGKRKSEEVESGDESRNDGRKKLKEEERSSSDGYSYDKDCGKSAKKFLKGLSSGRSIEKLCKDLEDDNGDFRCPFCRYKCSYKFERNMVRHIKSHKTDMHSKEQSGELATIAEETPVTVDSVSLKPEEGEYVFTVKPVPVDPTVKSGDAQGAESDSKPIEDEQLEEEAIAQDDSREMNDGQMGEETEESQEEESIEKVTTTEELEEDGYDKEIQFGEEKTAIRLKMEDDSQSVSSMPDLEAQIRLMYLSEDGIFKCPFCQYTDANVDTFLEHLKTERKKKKTYQPMSCHICGRVSYRKDHFIIHMRTHTDEKPFKCTWEDCDRAFKRRESLTDHIKRHKNIPLKKKPQYKPKTSYQCQECGKTVVRKDQLLAHIRSHSNDRPFKCPHCPSAFKHKTSLRCHVNTHLKKKLYKCDYDDSCEYETYDFWRYKAHLKHHKVKSLPKEKVACEICGAILGKMSLNSHRKMHSNEVFKCPVENCQFTINTKKRLQSHLQLKHELEMDGKTKCQVYQCNVCDVYTTPNKYLFEAHMKLHSGDKPFKCPYCDFATATQYTVKIHIKRRHSDVKPYICNVCGLAFKMKGELSKHLRSHSESKLLRPELKALSQGQQIILPEGAASFSFEDRDYSASEKEEIVSALYSLSGNIPETTASNILAARDENNHQVVYVYLPVEEEGGEGTTSVVRKDDGTVDAEQLIAQIDDTEHSAQPEYIQLAESGELIEAQVGEVEQLLPEQQVQRLLDMGKQHIQIDGQQYQIEEQTLPLQMEGQQLQLEDGSQLQIENGQIQVAGEGGHIIQQFIDEQGNIIEGQIITTTTTTGEEETTAAIFHDESASVVADGDTPVDEAGATIEGQQIFESQGQIEGQEVIGHHDNSEVLPAKNEDLQPGDSLLKPR